MITANNFPNPTGRPKLFSESRRPCGWKLLPSVPKKQKKNVRPPAARPGVLNFFCFSFSFSGLAVRPTENVPSEMFPSVRKCSVRPSVRKFSVRPKCFLPSVRPKISVRPAGRKLSVRPSGRKLDERTKKFTGGRFATNLFVGYKI